MAQPVGHPQPEKHVCFFALERKGRTFTGEVVCMVCGVYLSSQNQASAEDKAARRPENQGHL
jgi:hypothetical protein